MRFDANVNQDVRDLRHDAPRWVVRNNWKITGLPDALADGQTKSFALSRRDKPTALRHEDEVHSPPPVSFIQSVPPRA
jgi:hypothetical protein